MKTYFQLFATILLYIGSFQLPLCASSSSEDDALAKLKSELSEVKRNLDDHQWGGLQEKSEEMEITVETIKREPGQSESEYNSMINKLRQHTSGLNKAAQGHDPDAAMKHYLALLACSHFGTIVPPSNDTSSNHSSPKDKQSLSPLDQGNSKSDIALTASIRKKIMSMGNMSVKAQNVKIITRDGRVTLEGPVENEEERELIGQIALNMDSTRSVNNQIVVVPVSSSGE